jgi:activator of 2-hydroxyglutaryl-CoA dehydratase
MGLAPDIIFTGGVSNNAGMKKALEDILKYPFSKVNLDTIYAGALGAAIIAQQSVAAHEKEQQALAINI